MRLVIDMQGAQAGNGHPSVARYTRSLVKEIIRLRGENEVILLLNSRFPESIESLRAAFEGQIPESSILVMDVVESVNPLNPAHDARRKAAEMTREAIFARLRADIVLVTSLFETDEAVTSIETFTHRVPTAVILYDLIPFIHPDVYLQDAQEKSYYLKKIDHLRRADLLFSNSEAGRKEAIDYLGIPNDEVVNISTSCDSYFKPTTVSQVEINLLRLKFGLLRPFIMYAGIGENRENVERLIGAYARLSKHIRTDNQLAIVCSGHALNRAYLHDFAKMRGLDKKEVVIAGCVSEADLLALYNLCNFFVYPSFNDGFGIPALQAMACGRPVIGANQSGIPEVIGFEDALFDPYDEESIARKMQQVLVDEEFRLSLQTHGLAQAKNFSWEQTARRAWDALIRCASKRKEAVGQMANRFSPRPRLAYISPLPPEKSGISYYSAELLPELSRHYDIEVIVDQKEVSDPWIIANHRIRDHSWFLQNANHYDRVLYHFGNNAEFHEHMFHLLSEVPGVVVLHDFFLSGVMGHMNFFGSKPHGWTRSLLPAHGWPAVMARYKAEDLAEVVYDYPCNLEVIQQALGIIVHSAFSFKLAESLYGKSCTDNWAIIPHLRKPMLKPDRQRARQKLGLHEDLFVVCSFGYQSATKPNKRLLSAWLASPLASDANCQLVFVGGGNNAFGDELADLIKTNELAGSVKMTGWVDETAYRTWLQAATLGVQLRVHSRGETSGAILDCMNSGLATIVNACGPMANLPRDAVWMLPEEFSDQELTNALVSVWNDAELRRSIEARAREVILDQHQPRRCAEQYAKAIERIYNTEADGSHALMNFVARIEPPPAAADWKPISAMLANNFPKRPRLKQLLVDVSELVQNDNKTGVQRVVRGVLRELLLDPPVGWVIEPVYAVDHTAGYHYARRFTSRFLGIPDDWAEDEAVEAWSGDIFLGLDLCLNAPLSAKDCLKEWQRRGIRVLFVVYDLLPIFIPETFPKGSPFFLPWVNTICEFDGVICISQAVSEELTRWHHADGPKRKRSLSVNWFHLGSDVKRNVPLEGISADAVPVLDTLRSRVSFLTVATIEPRKGHAQTLAAFELLWSEGMDVNLVFVGKEGWMVESLIEKIRAHPELGKRFFWLEGISDGYLENVYSACRCLIAASIGEGFGLPLIEAAQHKLPILARDIPVFREVAGAHAFYFSGVDPKDLSDATKDWIALYKENKHPKSDDMPWFTWKQSTQQLLEKILG